MNESMLSSNPEGQMGQILDQIKGTVKNVGNPERVASVIAGGALIAYGVGRKSLTGNLLALLGGAVLHRGVTGFCFMYKGLGLNTAKGGSLLPDALTGGPIRVEKSVVINKSPDEIYQFWRNFENLPRFMDHLESVTRLDDRRSRWVAKAPAGLKVEWEAEITDEQSGSSISWRSLENADVKNNGTVSFMPARDGQGTEVRVSLNYEPPAGKIGAAIAKLFGEEPQQQVSDDLDRLKRLLESGELATSSMSARSF